MEGKARRIRERTAASRRRDGVQDIKGKRYPATKKRRVDVPLPRQRIRLLSKKKRQGIRQASEWDLGAGAPASKDSGTLHGYICPAKQMNMEGVLDCGDFRSICKRVIIHVSVSSLLFSMPPHFRLAPRKDHARELVNLVEEPSGKQEAAAEWIKRVSLFAGFAAYGCKGKTAELSSRVRMSTGKKAKVR